MTAKSANFATRLPSPVRKLCESPDGAELWVKDDSAIGTLYGGNKVRKLQLILPHAQARGAKRLVTFGAIGSHHVLATSLLGGSLGFPVSALLFPQPADSHVIENLKAALTAGLDAHPVASLARVPLALARHLRPGDYLIPAGGSGPVGSRGFYRAASELAAQVDARQLPAPDVIVVALGSGGTAAGLVAGLVACGLGSLVCAVDVAIGGRSSVALVKGLANWLALNSNLSGARQGIAQQLVVDSTHLGKGYGVETRAGAAAREVAADWDLALDVTYTSKAFAKALELGRFPGYDPKHWPASPATEPRAQLEKKSRASGRPLRVLYWHTLSRIRPAIPSASTVPTPLMKQFLPR